MIESSEQHITNSKSTAEQKWVRPDLWILLVLGVVGIVFFFCKFNESFPSASIDLTLSRNQITAQASKWADKLGYGSAKTVHSTVFSYDDDAKTFLEYELGQSRANALMKQEIPIWWWATRFCRESEMEELSVGLATDGQLSYFKRTYPNDFDMPDLTHQQAQALAQDFVEKTLGRSLAGTKLVKESEDKQVKRTDHYFTWEDETHEYKGARLRTYVYVAGNKVSEYSKFLHVPEKFERKFAEIRSYNDLLKSISSIIYTILASAISFIFVWAFASGRVRWRLAFFAGIVGALMSVLGWVDGLPSLINGYPTTMSFGQFMQEREFSALIAAFYAGLSSLVFIGALEPIYRLAFPEKIAVEKMFSWDGLRSLPVFQGLLAGLALFGLHTAYVVAFYLVGQHVGLWSPLEVRETSTLSGLMPVYSAIEVGISASVMEELMYRVLCMYAFRRIFKNFWVANFLQAAAWAFMHSDYPQEPAYARGLELTIGGFVYGYILRRYGLLACVLAHYTYDAFLGVTPLISSTSLPDKLTALIAVAPGLVALAVSIWVMKRRGTISNTEPLTNAMVPITRRNESKAEQEPQPIFAYKGLSQTTITAVLVSALAATVAFSFLPLRTLGMNNILRTTRTQAIQKAEAYLNQRGLQTTGYSTVAWLTDDVDETALQYVLEKEKFSRTAELVKSFEPRLVWKVRFFKPMDPHEYYVTISSTGVPLFQTEVQEEEAIGAKPDIAQARAAVEKFLHAEHPELEPFVFDDSTKHERKSRTDYDFSFKVPRLKAGEADFKIYSGTVGGTVSTFGRGWNIPDKWTFERNKLKDKDHIVRFLRNGMNVLLAILALLWAVSILKSGMIRWRVPIVLGGLSSAIVVLTQLNNLPVAMYSYSTDVALSTFIVKELVDNVVAMVSGAAWMGLASAFALGAYRANFSNMPLGSLLKAASPWHCADQAAMRRMWLDGITAGYCIACAFCGVSYILDSAQFQMSPSVHMFSLNAIRSMGDEWNPALGALLSSFSTSVTVLLVAAVGASFTMKYLKSSFWRTILAVLVVTMISMSNERYWQDYIWNVASTVSVCALAYIFVRRVVKFNFIGYLAAGFAASVGGSLYNMVRHAMPLYSPYALILLLALASPMLFTAWLYLRVALPRPAVSAATLAAQASDDSAAGSP